LSTWKTSFVAREICSIPTPSRLPNAIQCSAHRDAARAELGAAKGRLADTDIRAPFAGWVGLGYVGLGRLVTPQAVITTLDDTDIIKLDFDVPATWISPGHVATPGLARPTYSAGFPKRSLKFLSSIPLRSSNQFEISEDRLAMRAPSTQRIL
jgi:hypothetical protein